MKAKVVGTRRLNFVNRDGEPIVGLQVFVTYPCDDVYGEKSDKVFISDDLKVECPVFVFGSVYDFVYESVGFGRRAKNRLVAVLEV